MSAPRFSRVRRPRGDAGLSAEWLLRLWEVGAPQHPLDRALTILIAAEPDRSRGDLAHLPSGRRDQQLLLVYERTFGNHIAGQGTCPACGGRVEFSLDARELLSTAGATSQEAPLTVAADGYTVTCRPPDSFDLAAIAGLADVAEARRRLLERCIISSTREDAAPVGLDEVPEAVIGQAIRQMAASDPLAEIELALTCPACDARWQLAFDIVAFLWLKIEAQARRLLREVHAPARAYGWREADILAMTPARRQAYLEMVN
jgi:hypothetical protein